MMREPFGNLIEMRFRPSPLRRSPSCEAKSWALAYEFAALPLGWADDEDLTLGDEVSPVKRFDGHDGGLAPLARAVKNAPGVAHLKDLRLDGVGVKSEGLFGELGCVEFAGQVVVHGEAPS
jgi:hypothetical protein